MCFMMPLDGCIIPPIPQAVILLFLWPLLMDKKGSKSLGECDEWEHGFRGQSSVKKCRDMIIAGKDKTIG